MLCCRTRGATRGLVGVFVSCRAQKERELDLRGEVQQEEHQRKNTTVKARRLTSPRRYHSNTPRPQYAKALPRDLNPCLRVPRHKQPEIREDVRECLIPEALQIPDVQNISLHIGPPLPLNSLLDLLNHRRSKIRSHDSGIRAEELDLLGHHARAAGIVEDVRGGSYRRGDIGEHLGGDEAGAIAGHALVVGAVAGVGGGGSHDGDLEEFC